MKYCPKRKRKLHPTKKSAFLESIWFPDLAYTATFHISVGIVDLHKLQGGIHKPYRLAASRKVLVDFLDGILGQITRGDNFDGQHRSTLNRSAVQLYLLKMFAGNKSYVQIPYSVVG